MLASVRRQISTNVLNNLRQSLSATTAVQLLPYIHHHFTQLMHDRGDWNRSVYDLAWVLRTNFFSPEEKRQQVENLFEMRNPDGTWGDARYLPHAALIDTLAALMALVTLHQSIPKREAACAGIQRLVLEASRYPHHDTVAFEILAPKLIHWLEAHQFPLDLSPDARYFLERLEQKGDYKLNLLRQTVGLFGSALTISHSLELAALIPLHPNEVDQLTRPMLSNGAIGLSPAATAGIMVALAENGREIPAPMYGYLQSTLEDYEYEGFPDLHPITTSRRLWNARPWLVSGSFVDIIKYAPIRETLVRLYNEIPFDSHERVSWDTHNLDLPDLDDTAMAFGLYSALARNAPTHQLQPMTSAGFGKFQREDGSFFCFPYELHPSTTVLLHTVMALEIAADTFGIAFADDPNNLNFIEHLIWQINPENKNFDEICSDKWHATWTYTVQTWFSVRLLHVAYRPQIKMLLHEVMDRMTDGGWGQNGPTLEETAYVASGLASLLTSDAIELTRDEEVRIRAVLRHAYFFMRGEVMQNEIYLPPLWINKNMYAPQYQIVSAVLEAFYGILSVLD